VLNGKHTGKKGIIIKSNYENSKERKFPHCLVVGLSKAPKRVTKKYLKKVDEKVKNLEKNNSQEQINRLKRVGVFIKTYNMSHLLATRYKVDEDFGISSNIEKLDKSESEIKEKQANVNRIEHEKKEDKAQELKEAKEELGKFKDEYKQTLRSVKSQIGTELFNRYMRGFVRTRDNVEENEKIAHSEFLFKKLKF
jgi:hypothetical protein